MRKYLFYFSYFGKSFSGLQKQSYSGKNDKSIAKYLEDALLCLTPLNTPKAYVSSRTDSGVHAVCSTFQAILSLPPSCSNFPREEQITNVLNKFFYDSSLDIRIHKTQIVPQDFNCRALATVRTYLYRIAWVKADKKLYHNRLPIPELNKCMLIERPIFNLEKAQSVCDLFKGTHDFKNFSKTDKTKIRSSIRTIHELTISPGQPFFDATFDERYEALQFFDVVISSGGFLWNQVRRIVGTVIDVASDKVPIEKVEHFLNHPEEKCLGLGNVAKPDGLFLLKIQYPPEAFIEDTYKTENNIKDLMAKVHILKTGGSS